MPDRVREAVFSILESYYGSPGCLPPLRAADAFAGSGSAGLEALSRGAESCCFFEHNSAALEALRQNLTSFGVQNMATIVTRNAWRWAVSDATGRPFDLVFLDPPYRDSEDVSDKGSVRLFLARFVELEDNNPVVVLHHSAKVAFSAGPCDRWRIVDRRTFGTSSVTFFAT